MKQTIGKLHQKESRTKSEKKKKIGRTLPRIEPPTSETSFNFADKSIVVFFFTDPFYKGFPIETNAKRSVSIL